MGGAPFLLIFTKFKMAGKLSRSKILSKGAFDSAWSKDNVYTILVVIHVGGADI